MQCVLGWLRCSASHSSASDSSSAHSSCTLSRRPLLGQQFARRSGPKTFRSACARNVHMCWPWSLCTCLYQCRDNDSNTSQFSRFSVSARAFGHTGHSDSQRRCMRWCTPSAQHKPSPVMTVLTPLLAAERMEMFHLLLFCSTRSSSSANCATSEPTHDKHDADILI